MIRELHDQIQSGKKKATELVAEYFARIKDRDQNLHAFLSLREAQALAEAEAVDAAVARGETIDLLAGIPGAVKDNMLMVGERTTAGSKILDNYVGTYDATAVAKLKDSQAIILGKTNLDEFALGSSTELSAYGPTKNPIDDTRVPGGTSGGSAVAVATDMSVWALGSDTGGSIRQPAAFCGVYGMKPTYGRVSRSGLIAAASSLDQIGAFGKTVEDVAIVLSRIAGVDALDGTASVRPVPRYEEMLSGDIRGRKIGVPTEYFTDALDAKIKSAALAALDVFKSLGAEIVPISLPHSHLALPIYYIVQPSELSSNLSRFDGIRYGLSVNDQEDSLERTSTLLETYLDTRKIGLGPEAKRRIMLGTYALSAGYYDAYYKKALAVRALLRQDFQQAFETVDVIFSPTTPEVAFKIGAKTDDPLQMYFSDIYTVTANLVGVPAMSFPIGTIDTDGKALPIGGQFMGRWFEEETLLSMTHAYELANKRVSL
ncbi:MAG: Asp-tRNA(Asn)/Glu-tRNA(Gln) amidotransferase subunit GatA [Candidatus Moraniibacteriota bacterium]